jgi:hypothetical protein
MSSKEWFDFSKENLCTSVVNNLFFNFLKFNSDSFISKLELLKNKNILTKLKYFYFLKSNYFVQIIENFLINHYLILNLAKLYFLNVVLINFIWIYFLKIKM